MHQSQMELQKEMTALVLKNQAMREELDRIYSNPYWRLAHALVKMLSLMAPKNTLRGHVFVFLVNVFVPVHMNHTLPALPLELDDKYDGVAIILRQAISFQKIN